MCVIMCHFILKNNYTMISTPYGDLIALETSLYSLITELIATLAG